MSGSDVMIDEEALADAAEVISAYANGMKEAIDGAVSKLGAVSGEWDDEDHETLTAAIRSFEADAEAVDVISAQLRSRIQAKLDAIRLLHSMEI